MKIGDAFGRIDHRQLGAVLVAGMQVAFDFVLFALRQRGDLVVQIGHAVVDVHTELFKQLGVFFKRLFVENLDAVAKHDGVRHLHHGCLDVQREHHTGLEGVVDLFFVELNQGLLAHEHAVNHLAIQQRHFGLEQDGFAGLGDQLHLDITRTAQRHGLFTMVKIARVHVRHVRTRGLAPLGHAVRVFAGVFLDGTGCAAIGVAFAQHRVHGAAQAFVVAQADGLLFVVLRLLGVVGQLVSFALQFADGADQLVLRGTDIGQLDDVGVRQQGEAAQFGQVVRHFLGVGEEFGKLAQNARGHRDIAFFHMDVCRRSKRADHRQKSMRCQQRRFIGEGVNDVGFLSGHGFYC